MARKLGRLTALEVSKTKTPGLQHDGGGLYLQVRAAGADERGRARVTKSWLYRFTLRGKADWMGLGGVDDVSLAQARRRRGAVDSTMRASIPWRRATPRRSGPRARRPRP